MVISCASPCIQGISDVATAEDMAVMVNNILAESISNNTSGLGGLLPFRCIMQRMRPWNWGEQWRNSAFLVCGLQREISRCTLMMNRCLGQWLPTIGTRQWWVAQIDVVAISDAQNPSNFALLRPARIWRILADGVRSSGSYIFSPALKHTTN